MLHCVESLAALLGRLRQRGVLRTLSPSCLGMFFAGVYLILTCNALIFVLKVDWLCSTLDFIVSGQHRKLLSLLTCSSEGLLTVSRNVTDLPRSVQVEHVALIISSYPLTY